MAEPTVRAMARQEIAIVSMAARGRDGAALAELARRTLGVTLPKPGKWAAAGELCFICTAPDQWLVLREGDDGALPGALAAMEDAALLIELSGSRVAVRVSGLAARAVLAKVLPIDLHPRAMQPGDAAATLAAHLPVLVCQRDDEPTYDLICASSFAGSFYRSLELAGAPVSGSPEAV